MYCEKCGSLVKHQGLRVPECCNVCGAKFKVIPNLGIIICGMITMFLMIPIVYLLKKISSNENLIYIIGLILLMVIFNITESILLKLGIVQYKNLKL